ncbi:MAG: MmcQ/YjbR family DNA-binding protein [Clostridiales bacterium]|nr:MmcQ/YjbR family DNA-binding protein [Clostridiales bacterium]
MMRKVLFQYILDQYGVEPEFPWDGDEDSAVFRHKENRKWFALAMKVRKNRVGLSGEEVVDVVNLKIDDPILHDELVHEKGIVPGYHMNKSHWITVLLDGTVPQNQVFGLLDVSFSATGLKKKKRK